MNRQLVLCSVIFILCTMLIFNASGAAEQIKVNIALFRCSTNLSGDTSLEDDVFIDKNMLSQDDKKALTIFTKAKLNFNENILTADKEGWKWNGSAFDFESLKKIQYPQDKVTLMSSPQIIVSEKETASINISSQQKIEYFEKSDNGLFELKSLEEPTGLEIEVTGEKIDTENIKLTDFTLSVRFVEKREGIKDTTLDVGKPVLKDKKFIMNLKLKNGKDYGILLFPQDGQGFLMLKIKTELMPKTQNK